MKEFIKYNNLEVIDDGEIQVKVNITENTINPFKIVHGGLIFTLGDTVMGMLCQKNGRNAVTLDSSINFISPGIGKYLVATAKIIKDGKKICVLESEIKNDEGKLVATMRGTYYYIK